MNKNAFILLKAIFSEELHNAVLSKDKNTIEYLLVTKYQFETENGFYDNSTEIDLEYLCLEHKATCNGNLDWAL